MIFPDNDRTPLFRTDFSHDEAWQHVVDAACRASPEGFCADLNVIDDRRFDGADPDALAEVVASKSDHGILIVADKRTMADPEMSLLCLDPLSPGANFRVVPAQLWSVENNVSLANMDFGEFAEVVDPDGVFRGFRG